ncbi:MAG: hypothetical protein R2824_09385 [Saprospiraceae bacterium]|nr:hypothetical protein [Lewinella sp.]
MDRKTVILLLMLQIIGAIHSGAADFGAGPTFRQPWSPKQPTEDFIRTDTILPPMSISDRPSHAETGSIFMARVAALPLAEREGEIYKALAAGNMPDFLRRSVHLTAEFADSTGAVHSLEYEVLPDYLAIGSDADYCRIPMNPHTAQRLATLFGASLITAKLSDHIYSSAEIRLEPFFYKPVGNANETVEKFVLHNAQIEQQKTETGGMNGQLIAGIKKDVILSERIAQRPDRVVIYGWHKPDGQPIQPVYSGHIDWYVDYSHGIRLMNEQVLLDGKQISVSGILTDPILYKVLSNEDRPMSITSYSR